jgi:hypothetical protein
VTNNAAPNLPINPGPATSQTQAAAKPRTRVLLGFFQTTDALPYLQSVGADVDATTAAASHSGARAHVDAQIGQRVETTVTPIHDCPHLVDLRGEPTFAEHAANAKVLQFAYVEVGKLVACQPRVDWDHIERLAAQVPEVGNDDELLRFCLPLQRDGVAPQVQATFNPVTNTFGCIVDNPDVRICGPAQGGQAGTGRALVGFTIGPGLHQMSVKMFNGRYMLNNGYHRAVALARAGHDRIPVILTEAPALDLTPTARNGMFSPQIVFGPKPPRIADFMAPAAVDFTSRRMRLLFSVHAEVHPIPG